MTNLIRERWPAGEALSRAVSDSAQDWAIVKNSEVVGPHDSILSAAYKTDNPDFPAPWGSNGGGGERRKRSRSKGGDAGKGGGRVKKERTFTIGSLKIMGPFGKLCGAFNSKKGCTMKNCRSGKHSCGYIVNESGDICGERSHGCSNH
jgi:hypothetical protein